MLLFTTGILLVLVAVVIFAARRKLAYAFRDSGKSRAPAMVSVAVATLGAISIAVSMVYFQDPGEAIVLRSFTGTISGISSDAGLHTKSPFDSCIRFDVRNNTVTFVGDGTEDEVRNGTIIGPQITFQDKEGVTGNLDIVVRYSLDPQSVSDIYINYLNQENFVSKTVGQDVRSISRQIPGRYGTLAFFNSRAEAEQEVYDALESRWEGQPIIIEAVNLQEIRYSDEIKQRYDDAQSARVAIDKAQAELEAAGIQAETARTVAQGQADANAILEGSLTDRILQQKYIDAINDSGTVYVVPNGSTPFIGVTP